MGVVVKKSFWTSILAYLGVIIGYINTIILYPLFLKPDQIGLIRTIQSAALLLIPLSILGMGSSAIKFHPEFPKNTSSRYNFFMFLIAGTIIGFLLVSTLMFVFQDYLIAYYIEEAPEISEYFNVIIILLFFLSLMGVLESISKADLKIITPNFIKDVYVRITSTTFIILYSISVISFHQLVYSLMFNYGSAMMILFIYLIKSGTLKISFKSFTTPIKKIKEILNFAMFSILGAAGSVLVLNIDIQMVTAYEGFAATGIYTTGFYIAVVIDIPRKAISQVAGPIIAQSFKDEQLKAIEKFYKSISINQSIIGLLIFSLLIINIENLYSLMPNSKEYITGINVVYIIGSAKLIDMIFSINSEILMLSKHYRFNIILVAVLGVFTVLFNVLLIPDYGITGAAMASLLSIFLFNICKLIYVYMKFRFFPFTYKNILVIGIAVALYFLNQFIPKLENVFIDIFVRSAALTISFTGLILILRISEEINEFVNRFFNIKNK